MNRMANIRKRVDREAATTEDAAYLLDQVDILRDQIIRLRLLEGELGNIVWQPLAGGEPPLRHRPADDDSR